MNIAIVGTGISGMSAAWLLSQSQNHNVTVFEADNRIGGHSHTVDAPTLNGSVPVDTGFIVYNKRTYPNLTALFDYLDVPTYASTMSFSVSCRQGGFEYGGGSVGALLAQKSNLIRPHFWTMLNGIRRFYRDAPKDIARLEQTGQSLGDYLDEQGYHAAFQEDHLLPMAAAIWSAPSSSLRAYPAASFIRFCVNHGLLQLRDRPEWRSVKGGSREYIARLTAAFADRMRLNNPVTGISRTRNGDVLLRTADDKTERFDHVVIATHADHALGMLDTPSADEARLLGCFKYQQNVAVLHSDIRLMPRRHGVWSAWNYHADQQDGDTKLSVTYWMNRLQSLDTTIPYFVTLNPTKAPRCFLSYRTETYEHPVFNDAAMRAQKSLWSLQGQRNTWFCGAYFGAGFHEDGLQAGLAVAEQLGGVLRPWSVPNESGRIHVQEAATLRAKEYAA